MRRIFTVIFFVLISIQTGDFGTQKAIEYIFDYVNDSLEPTALGDLIEWCDEELFSDFCYTSTMVSIFSLSLFF